MALAYRIVILQIAATLVVAGLWSAWDRDAALAALAAGLVCVVPNGYFAWRASRERSASRLLASGVARFVGTVVLMAVAIAWLQPAPLVFFGVFGLLQLAHVAGAGRAWAGT